MNRAPVVPFTRDEVIESLARMPRRKTAGLALYTADHLRHMCDGAFYDMVAQLFGVFAVYGYPRSLNRMLLFPLYKGKGAKASAVNYRPISLIHPVGRWYATCLNARLEQTTRHCRADC